MKRLIIVLLTWIFVIGASGCGDEQASKPAGKPAAAQSQSALIDINRASKEELMTLKGIGEARAQAIIRGRPYSRKDEILQKGLVPATVYDKIKNKIIARRR